MLLTDSHYKYDPQNLLKGNNLFKIVFVVTFKISHSYPTTKKRQSSKIERFEMVSKKMPVLNCGPKYISC